MLDKTFGGALFMAKYSNEVKMEVVRLLKQDISYTEIKERFGVDNTMARQWLGLYDNHGAMGLFKKNRSYTGEFKVNVVEWMHKGNHSTFEAAAHFGLPSKTQALMWERIYYEQGPAGLYIERRGRKRHMSSNDKKLDKKIEEDLIAEVQRLRAENAYLKKLDALVQERIKREHRKKLK